MRSVHSALAVMAIVSVVGCGGVPGTESENSLTETASPLLDGVTLRNLQTDYCLGTAGGGSAIGSLFVVWACDGSANQRFTFQQVLPYMPPPYFEMVNNVANDRCIWDTNLGQCISNDAQADAKIDGYKSTRVLVNHNGHDCYTFENELHPGEVLGVSGGSTAEGARVILWHNYNDLTNHPDQAWCIAL